MPSGKPAEAARRAALRLLIAPKVQHGRCHGLKQGNGTYTHRPQFRSYVCQGTVL